jgi:hypothetical protein
MIGRASMEHKRKYKFIFWLIDVFERIDLISSEEASFHRERNLLLSIRETLIDDMRALGE